ncbi:MAG: monovalent cation/H+ antiporter complex subunit F, partial [Bacteroidales bacterium]|nr:monovalent cation/H+ antiporter complex subunit F [Bacteroidales bacterium]
MINTLLFVALGVIVASVLLVLIRFAAGPGLANRMVAFDVMTIGTIGLIAIYTALSERFIYLDVAIVYG